LPKAHSGAGQSRINKSRAKKHTFWRKGDTVEVKNIHRSAKCSKPRKTQGYTTTFLLYHYWRLPSNIARQKVYILTVQRNNFLRTLCKKEVPRKN
jgi:hypothetical protein